jgi:hypothetical protein
VDLPTLGKPTMPHLRLMEKVLKNQDPGRTIKPNGGMFAKPCPRKREESTMQSARSKTASNARFLSWGEYSRLYLSGKAC